MPSLTLHPFISSSLLQLSNTQKQIRSNKPANNSTPPLTLHSSDDLFVNSKTSVRILNSCAKERNQKLGSCIHAGVLKSGIDSNVFVCNSILDLYTKCGCLEDATKVFDQMQQRTIVSWTSIMSGYCLNGAADEAIYIFLQMLENMHPNEFALAVLLKAYGQKRHSKLAEMVHGYLVSNGFVMDQFLQIALIDMYAKAGSLIAVDKLMKRLSCRDVVSWTSAISGCVLNGEIKKAFDLFFQMLEDGVMPNTVTVVSIVQGCSLMNERLVFGWIHGFVIKGELCDDALVMNSLAEMYSKNDCFTEGMKIFGEFCFTGEGQYLSPETMANLIQGYGHSGCLREGEEIHGYVIKQGFLPCNRVENSLMDMYAENKQDNSAFQLFTRMKKRDIVSWNTMISCYTKNGRPWDALGLLSEFHRSRDGLAVPDFITVITSLQACSELASLQQGQIIHGYVTKSGFGCDAFVGNSLIDMYGKSGKIDFAEQVFRDMPVKDISSWNSMIAAYGINGEGTSALQIFSELKESAVQQPNAITFVNLLSSCCRSGLVEEGLMFFNSMDKVYGIEQSMEHFACMVDLLGRSGQLEEAEVFIEKMPLKPGPAVWGALLGTCGFFGNAEIAKRAAERLSILEPESSIWRVALSNVYAGAGRWKDAAKVRAEIKANEGRRKDAGWSSVEVRGENFKFMVGDTRHPESKEIYEVLNELKEQMRNTTWVAERL